ncbi:MAG: hypothetical protein BWY68_00645 [bacterium ADurb.Bin400]|nr:MAG: hypothetical protein BWY68_00645 [bacterium ADurb.Bin400]
MVRGELTGEFQHHLLEHALRMDPKDKVVTRIPSPPTVLKRPIADWSWMNPGDYLVAPVVQTSVGCPFGCSFCSVTEVFGAQMRAVCLNELRAELEQLPKTRLIGVIDDNFLQGIQDRYINHCIAVATLFHELGFRWVAEVTVRTLIDAQAKLRERGSNLDLVEYFAKCGCRGFFFGIETLEENGAGLSKVKSQQDTANLIKHCHQCGLMVLGAFVLGVGETETADHAKRILEFAVEETKLDFAQFTINTPMPGARSFLTGIRDNTIFNFDWELYDGQHCVARHPVMSPQELEESHFWLYQEFYRWRSIGTRVLPALLTPKPLTIQRGLISLPINGALHQSSRRWKQRLLSTSGNRPIIAQPDETVLEQVASALQNYAKPADLFNLKHPDGLSRPINTK